MIKISALNDESEEESGSEEEVTKEALEQIALQQYAKALDLQRKGNVRDATQLLKDLLNTEVLYDIKKPAQGEKITSPLFNLKYVCYKNLASMLSISGETDAAIDAYCAASELDDTDVTLWNKLGQLCLLGKRFEMALNAFQHGVERNPRYWPCLDKIVTLLLGLDFKEDCIAVIYEALQLDPGYLRGLSYRKHIYTKYPYIRRFMEYLNPIYKWDQENDELIDEKKAEILLKEAEDIHESFIEKQKAEKFKYVIPLLKLNKPITSMTWSAVGESLVHMHKYISDNSYSYVCPIELTYEKREEEEVMEVCEEPKELEQTEPKIKEDEVNIETEKPTENMSETENNDLSDKDKATTDTEKVESDVEIVPSDTAAEAQTTETQTESKIQKKQPVRRRGSSLSFLQQWEWCKKRRSGRKKTANRQETDENIYDILRKMVPLYLTPEVIQKSENQNTEGPTEGINDIEKLFEEKDAIMEVKDVEYFGSENENKDVNEFIKKYTEKKHDVIDLLKDYLNILAEKWKLKWPNNLPKIFIHANECYSTHIDTPACTDDNQEDILHYTTVNILVEEFSVNDKLNCGDDTKEKPGHGLNVIESIGMFLTYKPHLFPSTDCLELMLRSLWVKLHIHTLNKCDDQTLECLYQLFYEFDAMGEHHDTYSLTVTNFTFKQTINETEILDAIDFLERNKKLTTVMDLYDIGNYEEVLSIVLDSFEHCKKMIKTQEDEMSLDFAAQLSLILDSYWALKKVDECFKWSLICLHEALKHYFRYTSGSSDYDKWTLAVVKILSCMEHILETEGFNCLETVSHIELSQGLEDLIRIIGHQVETNTTEMPFDTVSPWIIMYYILQREEDQGRGRPFDKDKILAYEVPTPLLLLFIAHEHLGQRNWCCRNDGKLLYFILDTVVPLLRSPLYAKSLEQICQYMEQCVFCLFAHPGKKSRVKYIVDHKANPHNLEWKRAQQLYEIFRPPILPGLEGKISGITLDTEQLFLRILALLPPECDPQKHVHEVEKYIKGLQDKVRITSTTLPYKMRDIYFLLGDYYFKKDDGKMAVKYNMLDVVVNNDRLESWAEIALAKSVNLETLLNSCKNLHNEREFLNPAKAIIRCFKRALELDPTHCNLWIEYGIFVYTVHSFCSRLLKQASESLSMEDFESLEKQKEEMLDTTQKCFITVLNDLNNSKDGDKKNVEAWLYYYMLGKVAEKRNKPPSVYLDYYMKGVRSLEATEATYPLKINYNTPSHLCIEVLEFHYRIHASILKYIEQHDKKPIPASVGKVFLACIDEWQKGPFSKKPKKDCVSETESELKPKEPVHAANILKRSVSDSGEDDTHEVKRLKMEAAAAKVRRSASYDTERIVSNSTAPLAVTVPDTNKMLLTPTKEKLQGSPLKSEEIEANDEKNSREKMQVEEKTDRPEKNSEPKKPSTQIEKKDESSSETSSSSSSDSSSSDSSSDSGSDSSRDSDASANASKPLSEEEITKITAFCLDALEDCASRFPQHYKAIYRLAHYHFYCKRGLDIERCRDLMLLNFTSRSGQKLGGLFSERRQTNFFNNIWKIPLSEVERPGGFAFHMSRSVQLTMEILKEIDDHKTLLDLSLHLQRIPDADKKYLRDSDREELAQQAFSLSVQSLKGQLLKFSQQPDLRSNEVERQALNSLMLDIHRAYQRVQKEKQPNIKQFTNLLVDGYKLATTELVNEEYTNLVDLSLKYCQKLKQKLKYEAFMASLEKSNAAPKKQTAKTVEQVKSAPLVTVNPPKIDQKATAPSTSASGLPKMSTQEMAAAFQNYLPVLNDSMLSQQTAAALSLSYLSNMSALAGYSLQNSLHNSLQNSFQAEFYRQFLENSFSSYLPPVKKQKRGPKQSTVRFTNPSVSKPVTSKSLGGTMPTVTKATPMSVSTSLAKLAPTSVALNVGGGPSKLPASLSNLSNFGTHTTHSSLPAPSNMAAASASVLHPKHALSHQQISPGKTLQEKLAERQKHMPISKTNPELSASISKLPSSLTITKTSVTKQTSKKPEFKKSLSFSGNERPKPIAPDEVIVLDDD